MALGIPLTAVPNQIQAMALEGQSVLLAVYQRASGLYMDVISNGSPIILGVLCENKNPIVRNAYLGFLGDFFFFDSQAPADGEGDDPNYTGLGDRFQLIYLESADIEAARNGT